MLSWTCFSGLLSLILIHVVCQIRLYTNRQITLLAPNGIITCCPWYSYPLRYCCFCLVTKLCLTLCDPMDCNPSDSSVWDFLGKTTRVGCHFLPPGYLPDPGIEPVSSALAGMCISIYILVLSQQGNPITLQYWVISIICPSNSHGCICLWKLISSLLHFLYLKPLICTFFMVLLFLKITSQAQV